MHRGKPLYLNEERYAALTNMVLELYVFFFLFRPPDPPSHVYKCTSDSIRIYSSLNH